jgi:hypothetical protein
MTITIFRRLLLVAAMLGLSLLGQTARADSFVDFSCGGSSCSGTVTNAGGVYSTTGIGGFIQGVAGGPDFNTGAFSLIFNTSTDAISLTGNAAAGNDTLLGSIVGAVPTTSSGQTLLALSVNWTSLPTDFKTYLNASSGTSVGSVIYLASTGAATSVDFTVTPTATPEPSTVLMLGGGLLGLCGLCGRKAFIQTA